MSHREAEDAEAALWAQLTGLPIVKVERDGDTVLLSTSEDDQEMSPMYTFNSGSFQLAIHDPVTEIGDEHRDRVWRDRNGDYWKWYDDGERRGWKYQSPHNRWRFGGMHIPSCGPYTPVEPSDDDFT